MTYFWIITLIISTALMFFLVPAESIRRYNLFGLVAGFLVGLITLYFMIPVFNYWNFKPDPFTFVGIPISIAATWWPLEIIFAHYFVKGEMKDLRSFGLILVLPIISTLFHGFSIAMDLLNYNNWSYFGTFLFSVVIQIILSFYLRARVGASQIG